MRVIVLWAAMLLVAVAAFAQSRTTGAIAGEVEGPSDNPLPGATVDISSPALIKGVQTTITDAQGRFRFSDVPPGRYRVNVTASGYKTAQIDNVSVAVGQTAELPVEMQILGGQETVTVRAAPPAIDPTTSAVSTILTSDHLRNIPNDREPSHIFNLAPGINMESAYGGGEESGNAYELDGVDVSDPQGGAPWSLFSYSLIDEVQLVGLGAPAEYGQFTGVVFNSVTKSGGNDSSGSAEFLYSGQALTGNSGLEDLNASIDSDIETTFQLGGPLRRDRVWYFLSGQYRKINSSEGGPTQHEKTPRFFAKLSAQLRENSTLQGWVERDHTKIIGRDATEFTPIEATSGENNPETVGNLSFHSVVSPRSLVSVAWSGLSGHRRFDPFNGVNVPGHIDVQTGFSSANAPLFELADRSRNQLNASFSHHATNLLTGFHDFKVGTEIESSRIRDRAGLSGGAFFSDNEGPIVDPSTGKSDFYTLVTRGGSYDAHGKNQRVSFYAQDSWRITSDVTINAGFRYDRNRGAVPGATVFSTNGLAPRLGFAWDFGGNGRSVLKAHYGRYYEALYSSFYYYMTPGGFQPRTTERIFNTSRFTQRLTTVAGQRYAMDPHIKQPHLDQVMLAFDQQLPRDIVLTTALVYRKNADFIETVSRDGIFVPVKGTVPDTGQEITLYDYLNPNNDVLLYTNPKGLHRNYRALMVSATRPLRNKWQLAASYVYAKARGNIDNLGFDEFGAGGNTPLFSGGFLDTPNSLVNADGFLTHDQRHQVKLQATRLFPRRHLSMSMAYTYHSGDTWTPRTTCLLVNGACHDFPQGPVVYFAEPRGSRRLEARNDLDLRTSWQHRIRGGRELRLTLDMFNALNQVRATQVETLGAEVGAPATANFARSLRLGAEFIW